MLFMCWNMKNNNNQNKMEWNKDFNSRVKEYEFIQFDVCRLSIQQNKNKNIFFWRSFNMQIICENDERERKIGYCNKCIMHGQSIVNTHTHTLTLTLLCIPTLSYILSYFFSRLWIHITIPLASSMNCKELLYVISHYRSFVCACVCVRARAISLCVCKFVFKSAINAVHLT